jgi:hypothetical protein
LLSVLLDCPFMIAPSVFSNVYLSCDHCCQFLWIVPSVFSTVYLLCDHCCQFLWVVLFWLPLLSSVFSNVYLSCDHLGQSKKDNPEELTTMVTGQINVREYRRPKGQFSLSCDHCCQFLLIVLFGLPLRSSVFSNVYLSCDHCCQCFWIVLLWLPLRYSLTFICPVTIVVSSSGLPLRYSLTFICPVTIVVSSSGLSFFDCPFGLRYSPPFICLVSYNGHRTNKRWRIPKTEGAIKKGQSRGTDNNGHRTNKR